VASAISATDAEERKNGQHWKNDAAATSSFSTANNNHIILNVSKCEAAITSSNIPSSAPLPSYYKPLTRLQRLIYPHSYLPTPRLLSPNDTVFSYPQLTRGLIQRQKDEQLLRNLLSSTEVVKLRTATGNNNNNQEKQQQQQQQQQRLLQEMNTIIYGAGITSQIRQQFIIEYGCTGYTPAILII
jgi:hypothetical protein